MSRQTVLFTPGDEERMVEKSLTIDADMVVLDTEDAVAPNSKETACRTIVSVLRDTIVDDIGPEVCVRINPLDIRGAEDVKILAEMGPKIDAVMLPMVRTEKDVERLQDHLERNEFDANIIPIVETPESVFRLEEIATAPDVVALEFGAEDLTTELGGTHTYGREEVMYARQKLVVAASIADIDALDMAWPNFEDTEGLRQNAERAVEFGFDGKSAIHPAQLEVIRDAFTPDPELVEWAENVVEGAERAKEKGKVVFQVNGEMIDPPIIARAEDVLERAAARDY